MVAAADVDESWASATGTRVGDDEVRAFDRGRDDDQDDPEAFD